MNKELYSVRYDNWKFSWRTDNIEKIMALLKERKTIKEIENATQSECLRSYKVTWEHNV